jgi:type II secretory pathway pseudopilin PulG
LAAIAVPNHVRARQESQRKLCVNNIRLIEGAIDQYAIETKQRANSAVDGNLLAPYLKLGTDTACPAGGTDIFDSYNIVDCQTPVTCKLNPRHAVD